MHVRLMISNVISLSAILFQNSSHIHVVLIHTGYSGYQYVIIASPLSLSRESAALYASAEKKAIRLKI